MGAADRLAGGDARVELLFIELEAELLERGGHAQRALLAVGEEFGEPRSEHGACVVDAVAEDVQFAGDRRTLVDGRDLDRGHDPHAIALTRGDRLGDAADRVVVGQRQQLHARVRGALDHLRGWQGAVGVGGVRLQVEAGRHGGQRMRSLQELACSWACACSPRPVSVATRRPTAVRSLRTAAW